jgi:2-polyprenyl-3-methyl-5-hydroxy-6-metoxy-1,4-benzoquinol methylase
MASVTPFPYRSSEALCCAPYVFPLVKRLALETRPPPARLLDAGCGNGRLAALLASEGYDVTGVDLSSDGVQIARSDNPSCRFEVVAAGDGMLEQLDVEPFDLLVSTEVIEHLYDPHAFIEAARDALRPGGMFIVSTPYHGRLKNTLIAATDKFDAHVIALHNGGHIKFFSRATLTQLLTEHGFENVAFYGAGRLPWLWKSMVLTASRAT